MNLNDYLSKKDKVAEGETKQWLPFCTRDVTLGSLWAGDPHLANADDGCIVKVPRGQHLVEGIGIAEGRHRFVSRLRVRPEFYHTADGGRPRGFILAGRRAQAGRQILCLVECIAWAGQLSDPAGVGIGLEELVSHGEGKLEVLCN
jgi:hypothetical protein